MGQDYSPDADARFAAELERLVRDPRYIRIDGRSLVQGTDDPRRLGLDAAAGFPPHRNGFGQTPINDARELFDPEYSGTVVRYQDMVESALADHPSGLRYFPGVCPSWDNKARKPGHGFCVHGGTPAAYQAWLAAACRRMQTEPNPQERIVLIHAWNEWAEGAHLEPDRHYGYAHLARTARVVAELADALARRLRRLM